MPNLYLLFFAGEAVQIANGGNQAGAGRREGTEAQ